MVGFSSDDICDPEPGPWPIWKLRDEVRSGVKGQDLGELSRLGGGGRDPHLSTPGLPLVPLAFVLKANLKVGFLREGSRASPLRPVIQRSLGGVTPFQISPSEPDQRFPQPRQKEKGEQRKRDWWPFCWSLGITQSQPCLIGKSRKSAVDMTRAV